MGNEEKEVVLLLADISGYTRFMIASHTDRVHGQVVITELLKAVIRQVEIPLEISKLEGDAIFLYAVKEGGEASWEGVRKRIGDKLLSFFQAFEEKMAELTGSNICTCGACRNMRELKLKVLVHYGKALFYEIAKFHELSGVDVILVHRLLKNTVKEKEYVLLTEAAHRKVHILKEHDLVEHEEACDDFGTVTCYIYYPSQGTLQPGEAAQKTKYGSLGYKLKTNGLKGWTALLLGLRLKKSPHFTQFPLALEGQ
jgi:class 3 adenylate cyclase